jgi:hypothetical protein
MLTKFTVQYRIKLIALRGGGNVSKLCIGALIKRRTSKVLVSLDDDVYRRLRRNKFNRVRCIREAATNEVQFWRIATSTSTLESQS